MANERQSNRKDRHARLERRRDRRSTRRDARRAMRQQEGEEGADLRRIRIPRGMSLYDAPKGRFQR